MSDQTDDTQEKLEVEEKETVSSNMSPDVKSSAVVRYSKDSILPHYVELTKNTNLNKPPQNWLRGGSALERYVKNVQSDWGRRPSGFSSFSMANGSPDLVDELDVISDSENIKKLLKIPYNQAPVSMMVHRIGKTLLLDDFDIHKHLLRKQQDDWEWLRKFYYETVQENMPGKGKCSLYDKPNKTRDYLQNKNMFSKFLYYSIMDTDHQSSNDDFDHPVQSTDIPGHSIPDPLPEARSSEFQRTVIWNFEDIRMLIGTDLPIFGDGTRPCVSLRLREASQPINILTGIDYWLDNLMCNVPELAMCYHLNGIVQNYEILKTEDIPQMDESKFSPGVIKDIAQNILSFLKTNATKEGHTYWLFKEQDSDIVKLYDLTTLCADMMSDRTENPFTVPVGMLLYRVARNMRQRSGRKKSGTIRMLLKNCLKLLDKDKHAQVVTSANYLLSDLYIQDDFFTEAYNATLCSDESDLEDDHDQGWDGETDRPNHEKSETSVNVGALCLKDKIKRMDSEVSPAPVCGSVEERCLAAVKVIAEGLVCLDKNVQFHKKCKERQEEPQATCNPFEAIPLHYTPIHSLKKEHVGASCIHEGLSDEDARPRSDSLVLSQRKSKTGASWHYTSKVLLLKKAALAYYALAEAKLNLQKFGQALKYVKLSLHSYDAMCNLSPDKGKDGILLLAADLSLAGDVRLMLIHHLTSMEAYREAYDYMSEHDSAIFYSANEELTNQEYEWAYRFTSSTEQNLTDSLICYQQAYDITSSSPLGDKTKLQDLTKRLGNIRNELGVFYMNRAARLVADDDAPDSSKQQANELWKTSHTCFEKGIEAFKIVNDTANMALLTSNIGRLMRLCAQTHKMVIEDSQGRRREFSQQERHFFSKACDYYKDALEILGNREQFPSVWDSIQWELSSTYFTMATLLQDYAPLSVQAQEQVEKDVTDYMTKTLKYCDVDSASARQVSCQYRAATVHHRLASLYHNSYRNQVNDQKKKHLRQLAELHYTKATKFFKLVDSCCELLRVQLERVAMLEFYFSGQTSPTGKMKTLTCALDCLVDCKHSLEGIEKQLSGDKADRTDFEGYLEESEKLIGILQARLQFVLLSLVKVCASLKKGKMDPSQISNFKKMYGISLKTSKMDQESEHKLLTHCQHMLSVIKEVETLNKSTQQFEE